LDSKLIGKFIENDAKMIETISAAIIFESKRVFNVGIQKEDLLVNFRIIEGEM
jgi:hypothetical protein